MILEKVISLVAPHICLGCGAEGALLCTWCMPDAATPLPERCYRCNVLSRDSAVCDSCRRLSKLRFVWVRTQYGGLAKQLVYKLKFQRAVAAAVPIAGLLVEALPHLGTNVIITYVPTASSRYRQRGYDHAKRIAQEVAKAKGLRCLPLLARSGQTRQVGAKRAERLEQLSGAYRPKMEYIIKGAEILLIDDIVTTGATLEEAARVLKAAGAKRVNAAVFAQKQ